MISEGFAAALKRIFPSKENSVHLIPSYDYKKGGIYSFNIKIYP